MLYTDSLDAAGLAILRVYDPNVFTKIILGRNSRVMEDCLGRFRSKPHNCILPHFSKCLRQRGDAGKETPVPTSRAWGKNKSIHQQTQPQREAEDGDAEMP